MTKPSVMFDPETRVFSVDLAPGIVARTVEYDDSHLVDVDHDGRVLSIEVLTSGDPKIEEMAKAFGFEGRVPDIRQALDRALGQHTSTGASVAWLPLRGVSSVVGGEVVETRPAPTADVPLVPTP